MTADSITIIILIVAIAGIIFMVYRLINNKASKEMQGDYTIDDKYNTDKLEREKEMNRILDKIGKTGIKSLTRTEKAMLDKFSGKS